MRTCYESMQNKGKTALHFYSPLQRNSIYRRSLESRSSQEGFLLTFDKVFVGIILSSFTPTIPMLFFTTSMVFLLPPPSASFSPTSSLPLLWNHHNLLPRISSSDGFIPHPGQRTSTSSSLPPVSFSDPLSVKSLKSFEKPFLNRMWLMPNSINGFNYLKKWHENYRCLFKDVGGVMTATLSNSCNRIWHYIIL